MKAPSFVATVLFAAASCVAVVVAQESVETIPIPAEPSSPVEVSSTTQTAGDTEYKTTTVSSSAAGSVEPIVYGSTTTPDATSPNARANSEAETSVGVGVKIELPD